MFEHGVVVWRLLEPCNNILTFVGAWGMLHSMLA